MEGIIVDNVASVIENDRVYYTEEYVQNLRDELESKYDHIERTKQVLVLKHYQLGKDVPKYNDEMQKIRDIIDYLESI